MSFRRIATIVGATLLVVCTAFFPIQSATLVTSTVSTTRNAAEWTITFLKSVFE